MDRVLQAWGVDGHNSHTNICSAGARLGYAIWHGADRPSPDHANARFILLISAHLESGHYFNPHAQRIIEGLMDGAKMCVMDPRLSNTASMADYWMPTYPGSEAAVLLAIAKIILDEGLFNREFMYNWVNWRESLKELNPSAEVTFENFIEEMKKLYAEYTPEFAQQESGCDPQMIVEVARKIGEAGTRFSTHNWRSAGSGNLGGWAVSRCLHFLNVLTGSVGTVGGTMPSAWNKFKPKGFSKPPRAEVLEHAPLPERVSIVALRNELPSAAFPERRPREALSLFHARLQSRVDISGRVFLDGGAFGRNEDRPKHRSDADMERDGILCGLRTSDGPRKRAP